jgi:hypothetical protein
VKPGLTAGGRVDKLVAICVVASVSLALACYAFAELSWFRGAMAGMAGAYAREIDPQGAPWAEIDAHRAGLTALNDSRNFVVAGRAFLLLALAGTIAAAVRTVRSWRSWHWLTFVVSGPALAASWFAGGRLLFGTGSSTIWIPVACAAAIACAIDLKRTRSIGPGRIVAWSVLAVSVSAACIFAAV